ncbi:MAG: hypothetical protein R6X07_03610, partial [Desulfatiglandales bacterium]
EFKGRGPIRKASKIVTIPKIVQLQTEKCDPLSIDIIFRSFNMKVFYMFRALPQGSFQRKV